MKITNNEIRVELPELRFRNNTTVEIIKQMNPPRVVDVEALARLLCDRRGGHGGFPPASWDYSFAQHLAANIDKWLVEKKEDK